MDAALLISDHKFKSQIKGIIDYSKYMVDKKISCINKEIHTMKNEFFDSLSKSKIILIQVSELLESNLVQHSKEKVRLTHLTEKKSLKNLNVKDSLRLTPPIHIKNYEYVNPPTPTRKVDLLKSGQNAIQYTPQRDFDNKSEQSFTTNNTKNKYLEPLNVKNKLLVSTSRKSGIPNGNILDTNTKFLLKNIQCKESDKQNPSTPVFHRTHKKSVTKSPRGRDSEVDILEDNVAPLMKETQSVPVIKSSILRPRAGTEDMKKNNKSASNKNVIQVIDDRKFSIMDIQANGGLTSKCNYNI
jgi:hypothetical protein